MREVCRRSQMSYTNCVYILLSPCSQHTCVCGGWWRVVEGSVVVLRVIQYSIFSGDLTPWPE